MRFGCCGSMISPASDPLGIAIVEDLARMGFDYIELSLANIVELSDEAFARLCRRLASAGVACEACNNFFPPRVRLTGPDAQLSTALAYAASAMDRAASLGARTIVFGSSGAKNVPAGFDRGAAWGQIVSLLRHLAPLAQERGITIAIEPLNRLESNIVNNVKEGLQLLCEVDHPHVQLLVDYYHLLMEREDPKIVVQAGPAIRHLHLARLEGRSFPLQPDADFRTFFRCVRQGGYDGRCSIEAFTSDFAVEAPQSLRALREVIAST
jgi:D-psicose/D-tagatose/L-ribulose 3-epimerase